MIDEPFLNNLATKTKTSFLNITREYFQHLFLANFYRQPQSEYFLFKGGTALRLVYGSPRFSEDLDFSGLANSGLIEKILESTLVEIGRQGADPELIEAKKTSGGHLAIFEIAYYGEKIRLQVEVSQRESKQIRPQPVLITSSLVPAYSAYLLTQNQLVAEKIEALVFRKKPRDIFDLYFILRHPELHKAIKLEDAQRTGLKNILGDLDNRIVEKELKYFLPLDYWPVIKSLPESILNQLNL